MQRISTSTAKELFEASGYVDIDFEYKAIENSIAEMIDEHMVVVVRDAKIVQMISEKDFRPYQGGSGR